MSLEPRVQLLESMYFFDGFPRVNYTTQLLKGTLNEFDFIFIHENNVSDAR